MTTNPYRNSQFLISASKLSQFPGDTGREVAFVGRSNVGKSSVINCLTDNKRLAKTSKTPGRTRLINFFTVQDMIRLVDLPGYGFARVDKALKQQWSEVINDYFTKRQSLSGIILIVDVRRGLKDDDHELLSWCHSASIPVHILVNKADKLPSGQQKKAMISIQSELKPYEVSVQLFSAVKKTGLEEAVSHLNLWLCP